MTCGGLLLVSCDCGGGKSGGFGWRLWLCHAVFYLGYGCVRLYGWRWAMPTTVAEGWFLLPFLLSLFTRRQFFLFKQHMSSYNRIVFSKRKFTLDCSWIFTRRVKKTCTGRGKKLNQHGCFFWRLVKKMHGTKKKDEVRNTKKTVACGNFRCAHHCPINSMVSARTFGGGCGRCP